MHGALFWIATILGLWLLAAGLVMWGFSRVIKLAYRDEI